MASNYLPYNDKQVRRNTPRFLILGLDLVVSFVALSLTAYVAFDLDAERVGNFLFSPACLLLLGLRLASFLYFGTSNLIVRYMGEKDYLNLAGATLVALLAFVISYSLLFHQYFERRVFLISVLEALVFLVVAGTMRVAFRTLYDLFKKNKREGQPVAIFGAGEMGSMLERVLRYHSSHPYEVAAFFDDNPKVHQKRLNGIPVYNPEKSFSEALKRHQIQTVIIGIRDLPSERRAAFINACLAHKVRVLKLPPTESWINGQLSLSQLKHVNLEDLLGRSPIVLDERAVKHSIQERTILVTGCAGSIGSEILKQLLRHQPGLIIGLDIAESPLAELALEHQQAIRDGRLAPVIGDVRDQERMARLFHTYRPCYVFHAAAYKHVPIMEDFPEEAIKSNVWGTKVVADLAAQYRAEKFVMISTDKAVNPSNVMGASKRIAEMYVQALNFSSDNPVQFITTRFGNVLGSNGSVIPIFREQIEKGQPLTVTHPSITRYFMTIPEACSLVLEAGAMGRGGEIFVFDMGEPIRILDLAHRMIQLAGLTPDKDIPIQFTGLRPGEKLFEELLDQKEEQAETHHPKIFRAQVRPFTLNQIRTDIDILIAGAHNGWPAQELVQSMKRLVPEFISQNSVYSSLDKRER